MSIDRFVPISLGISLLAASSYGLANDDLNNRELDRLTRVSMGLMDEVIISTSRVDKPLSSIPNTVTVVTEADIQQQLGVSHDLSALLGNLLPSFTPARQKLSGSGETLRGRSPLFLVDGVPQSNPLRDGARDGHTIDPSMLERIEVIHGANAIHGMGASGGVINLITRKPPAEFEQTIQAGMGSSTEGDSESLGYNALYSAAGQIGQWDVMASVAHRESGVFFDADGEVVGVDNTQGDVMASISDDYFLKLGYNWDEQSLHLMVNHFKLRGSNDWLSVKGDFDAGVASSSEKGTVQGDEASNDVTTISLDYRADDVLGQELHLQLFSQEFSAVFGAGVFGSFQDPAFGADWVDQSRIHAEKIGMKLTLSQSEVAGLPLNLVYGLDLLRDETDQDLVQSGRQWVPLVRYDNYAPFVQFEYTGVEGLLLSAGVRSEHSTLKVDDFQTIHKYGNQQVKGGEPSFSENLYNVGATYALTRSLRVFANYAEGYSMADVGRVLRGINSPNLSVETFLDLEPVISENSEFGVEFHNERWKAQVSYYESDSDLGSRLSANADGIYSVNRERTEITGLEANVEFAVNAQASIGFMYSKPEGEYDSDGDDKVDSDLPGLNIAPERLNVYWNQQWSHGIKSRLQLSHYFSRDFADASGAELARFSGYNTVDLSSSVPLAGGVLQASAQNLSNEDYFTYYSQTAKNDKRNFKGMGRTVSLSYRYTF
ncbi:MAG: TonB-dependent receptor [Cycloclasticus sp.]